VIVMENAIWLPRLEPQFLKCNPRMVNDSMVVDIHQIAAVNRSINWHEEHRGNVDTLDVKELYWMDCCHRKGGWLFVCVVQLVKMLVEEWHVVYPM